MTTFSSEYLDHLDTIRSEVMGEGSPEVPTFPLVPAADVRDGNVGSNEFLVPGLIPSASVITFAGIPGVGKSFTALSWAASIAGGTDWFDVPVVQGKAVYVLGEGWSHFGSRISAWEKVNGVSIPEKLTFIDGAGGGLNLLEREHISGLINSLKAESPAFVVLDTFSMLAHVSSENDNSEVASVLAGVHRIVAEVGCSVMIIHHLSKSSRQVRGATALRGNVDTVIVAGEESVKSGTFFLSTEGEHDGKQRDGEPVTLGGFRVSSPGVITRDAKASGEGDALRGLQSM